MSNGRARVWGRREGARLILVWTSLAPVPTSERASLRNDYEMWVWSLDVNVTITRYHKVRVEHMFTVDRARAAPARSRGWSLLPLTSLERTRSSEALHERRS